ncbi:MAG: caspase family protein [Alphaproteobacteria bacterium]|nr:caspase family protein [Alphaproteobacteria bacterium]MBT4544203.1 caspase family protein [Alphaproteobacteria bacterium]
MAKRRGLTLKSCAILLGRTWFGDGQDEAALNSKSQLATGNPPSISSITNKNAVAVIIGNRNYKGRIPKVDYAKNDADAFMKFVTGRLGYDPENIIDLRDATKAELETAFGNTITHEGKLWRYLHPKGKSDITVYYSGHGVPGLKDRRSYLLPVDADPESPEINGYSLDTLFGNLGKLKARSVTVYLDACFSGDSSGGALTRSASGITIKARLPKAGKGMTVITAAQSDQLASWDHKAKHGLFTRHLLDALQGAADIGEYGNKDGQINIAETRAYLDEHLTRQARRDYGRVQNAWIKGGNKTVLATTE